MTDCVQVAANYNGHGLLDEVFSKLPGGGELFDNFEPERYHQIIFDLVDDRVGGAGTGPGSGQTWMCFAMAGVDVTFPKLGTCKLAISSGNRFPNLLFTI